MWEIALLWHSRSTVDPWNRFTQNWACVIFSEFIKVKLFKEVSKSENIDAFIRVPVITNWFSREKTKLLKQNLSLLFVITATLAFTGIMLYHIDSTSSLDPLRFWRKECNENIESKWEMFYTLDFKISHMAAEVDLVYPGVW